jgi:hypothetical protein
MLDDYFGFAEAACSIELIRFMPVFGCLASQTPYLARAEANSTRCRRLAN